MPNLNIVKTAKGRKDLSCNRNFKQEIYDKHSWICGCEVMNALFCFHFLLSGSNDSWSRGRIKDLGYQNQ
jgi:hypothetical protein